jgi:hypothetical protein
VLAELDLVSHVPAAQSIEGGRSAEGDIGGNRPPGGVDRKEDRQPSDPKRNADKPERLLRSADHFMRRIAKARSEHTLGLILEDAEASLDAWKRQPAPDKSNEPKYGTPQWKRYIAESAEKPNVLAKRFGVTRQYIEKVRREYAPPEPRIKRPDIKIPEVGCTNCGTLATAPHSDMCEACREFEEVRAAAGDPFSAEAA